MSLSVSHTQTKQIESKNAEDLRRLSEQESGARRRLEDSHARALRRGEVSLRRAEENVADLERVSFRSFEGIHTLCRTVFCVLGGGRRKTMLGCLYDVR